MSNLFGEYTSTKALGAKLKITGICLYPCNFVLVVY